MLFDNPIGTQSKIALACPLKKEGQHHDARTEVIGELFTFFAFERLREQKGVTYGAYASPRMYWGDSTELRIQSVVQNSGAGFAVRTMLDIVEEGANGDLEPGLIATNKWNVARTSVTGIQSNYQMMSAILGAGRENTGYFEEYRETLANVSTDDFVDALSTCRGHEIVSVVGPVEEIKAQFDEYKVEYKVYDWEELHMGYLSEKEKKKYIKDKAKAEEKRLKAEAAEATEAG
jgi:predicted Zn-dependent peptidase